MASLWLALLQTMTKDPCRVPWILHCLCIFSTCTILHVHAHSHSMGMSWTENQKSTHVFGVSKGHFWMKPVRAVFNSWVRFTCSPFECENKLLSAGADDRYHHERKWKKGHRHQPRVCPRESQNQHWIPLGVSYFCKKQVTRVCGTA